MEIIKTSNINRSKSQEKKRLNLLWGFVGTNRTGKSAMARIYAEIWRKNNPDFAIVSFDPQKRFVGISDWNIEPDDENWAVGLLGLRNALIILDDFRLINEKNTPVEGLKKLIYHRADWNIDIIYIAHNPSLIINLLTYFTSHYFLFYTEASDGSFQKKIANYQLCMNGQRLINKYVRANGRGDYPNFPHVIVDCETRELNAINFINHINRIK